MRTHAQKRLKKEIVDTDWSLLLSESSEHHSQQHVYRVAISPQCSWPEVWDFALDYGSQGTTCSLAFLKLFSLHVFSDNSCFVHNCPHHVTNETIAAHVLADHMSLNINIDQCVDVITSCSDDIMTYGNTLIQCFRNMCSSDSFPD